MSWMEKYKVMTFGPTSLKTTCRTCMNYIVLSVTAVAGRAPRAEA